MVVEIKAHLVYRIKTEFHRKCVRYLRVNIFLFSDVVRHGAVRNVRTALPPARRVPTGRAAPTRRNGTQTQAAVPIAQVSQRAAPTAAVRAPSSHSAIAVQAENVTLASRKQEVFVLLIAVTNNEWIFIVGQNIRDGLIIAVKEKFVGGVVIIRMILLADVKRMSISGPLYMFLYIFL